MTQAEQERERARLFRESLEYLESELDLVQKFESGELSSRLPREDWSSRGEWLMFVIQELRGAISAGGDGEAVGAVVIDDADYELHDDTPCPVCHGDGVILSEAGPSGIPCFVDCGACEDMALWRLPDWDEEDAQWGTEGDWGLEDDLSPLNEDDQ